MTDFTKSADFASGAMRLNLLEEKVRNLDPSQSPNLTSLQDAVSTLNDVVQWLSDRVLMGSQTSPTSTGGPDDGLKGITAYDGVPGSLTQAVFGIDPNPYPDTSFPAIRRALTSKSLARQLLLDSSDRFVTLPLASLSLGPRDFSGSRNDYVAALAAISNTMSLAETVWRSASDLSAHMSASPKETIIGLIETLQESVSDLPSPVDSEVARRDARIDSSWRRHDEATRPPRGHRLLLTAEPRGLGLADVRAMEDAWQKEAAKDPRLPSDCLRVGGLLRN